jgi:hypothetical protein
MSSLVVRAKTENRCRRAIWSNKRALSFAIFYSLFCCCGEFAQVCPPETTPTEWQADLRDLSERLTASCREVDPASTDVAIQFAHAADVVEGEATQSVPSPPPGATSRNIPITWKVKPARPGRFTLRVKSNNGLTQTQPVTVTSNGIFD